jgi:hypothetical protein
MSVSTPAGRITSPTRQAQAAQTRARMRGRNRDALMRPVALFWPYNNAQRRHLLRIVDE